MGWFLSSKKSKRKPRVAAGKGVGPKWDPKRTLRGLEFLGVVGLIAATGLGWQYMERVLGAYAARQRAGRPEVSQPQIELAQAPPWLSARLSEHLRRTAASQLTSDPLDQASLESARRSLQQTAWIERVWRVERTPRGAVVVHANYRTPTAMVDCRDGFHLVDSGGVRLAGPYRRDEAMRLKLPVIVGSQGAAPRSGQAWEGGDVQAGLALMRLLQDKPYFHEVRAADVSARDTRGRVVLTLLTTSGKVRWGLPPGEEQPIEPDANAKLRALASVWAQRRTINLSGRVIDVRLSNEAVFVEPAAIDEEGRGVGFVW